MMPFNCRTNLVALVFVSGMLSGLPTQAQQNDLFSSVRASTVFSSDEATTTETATLSGSGRLTSTESLIQALQKAEFAAAEAGSRSATVTKKLDFWQFPVLVSISDDEQDLVVAVGLRAISDSQKLPATRLLGLLEANQKTSRASFVFNRDKGRLELTSHVRNTSENAVMLRDEINRLAILARDNETLWNLDEASGGSPVIATKQSALEATKATQAVASNPENLLNSLPELSLAALQGRWAASRSTTEAFALQLNSDSTFVLVSVISGKQLRSSGKFTLLNGQLTLEGSDGVKIVAMVKMVSATEFQFTQQTAGVSGTGLSFRKAP